MVEASHKEKTQLGISLDKEVLERFRNLQASEKEKNKITQAQLLTQMMDAYENVTLPKTGRPITLVKYLQTPFERKSMQKMEFRGTVDYQSDTPVTKPLDVETARKLYDDFKCPAIELVHAYVFTHCFELYSHSEKECYVAAEHIAVSKNPNYHGERVKTWDPERDGEVWRNRIPNNFYDNPLELSRFRFVSNFDEFNQYFGRYASNDELVALGKILAEDIGDNYQLMDDLF